MNYQEQAIKSMAVKDGLKSDGHMCTNCGEICTYKEDENFEETNNRSTEELEEKGNMKKGNRFEER